MGQEELSKAHKLVLLLVTPTSVSKDQKKSWFLGILQSKVKEYSQAVDGALALSGDDCFDYVRCCVNALVNLKLELINVVQEEKREKETGGASAPKLEPDALSVAQQKSVSSLLEMVVVLGILPNLLPGVSVAIEKRSEFLREVLKDVPDRKILEKYRQLVFSLESLLDLGKHRSFTTLVMTKHLVDILAALIQISAAPLMKPVEDETATELSMQEDKFVMTKDLHDRLSADQVRYTKELERILERSYQPTLVKSMVVLHGSAKDKKNVKSPPKWFSKKVSDILTQRLTGKNGVENVIRGVLDMGGDSEGMDWQKIGLVAAVLGNPPEGNYASVENYYQLLCPQILDLLNHQDKIYQMIACASIKTVYERSLTLSRRYLLDVLMDPFIKVSEGEEAGLKVTEKELDECLKSIFKVFVIGTDPDMMFLCNLEKIILLLLEVHATIVFGVSHLRDPVKQIVFRYLKHMDTGTAIKILRSFALTEVPDDRKSQRLIMHKDLMFGAGDDGGIKVVKRVASDQSFYVSDDEKSIIVQDLLDELKDTKVKVDFYLSLMSDLTDIMVTESEPEPELPQAEEGQELVSQLLDLENHMDNMMHRMRRNLMVIRLLGLLSEDKVLQDNLMKESHRMITFIGTTLKRGAMCVGNDTEGGNSFGVMSIQSLNMCLSILSLHLTQANVSTEDWVRMQEYVTDLEVLSCHPDTRIAKIAGQLHRLVQAHGAIIEETNKIRDKTKVIQDETKKLKEKTKEIKSLQKESEDKRMDERKEQIRAKAEELKKAKERRKKCVKEEESEMKIVEDKTGMTLYESALYDIGDPLLPVRGHGIIELTRLIEDKDKETLENIAKTWEIFKDSLEDEDTYIYLSSITGLVACARYKTDAVLDVLTTEFTQVYQRKNLGDKAMEVRTKIGEALVRVTKELGEITPKYKNLLLNAFFSAASDPDELVRASSLSNLGEACRNLRFSLGSITGELIMHLESASRDKAPEVRRAAAMVLTMMLQGLGRDAFSVLESSLRDIHRSLRLRLGIETDEITLVHVNLALDEIDKIVRELFTPTVTQERVFVIDPHSN